MDGYRPSTYGDRFADVYDDWYQDVSDVEATVDHVAAVAAPRGGRVLELGAGSGRLAVPLARRGLDVWAVDASVAMIERLRAKPGAEAVHTVVDDMATLASPELPSAAEPAGPEPAAPPEPADRGFAVVLCAFNTLFNLPDTATQRRCLARVADLLAADGRLVIEAFVPPDDGGAAGSAVEARHIGLDEVVLSVSRTDPAARTVVGQHVQITEAGIRLRPWVLHYASPDRLDELAASVGLRLLGRHAGWRGEPFTSASPTHVSTYTRRSGNHAPADGGEAVR